MNVCFICGETCDGKGRVMTCSEKCHKELIDQLVATFGEYKKVVRSSTGETFMVPTRVILEEGLREVDLDKYPRIQ